MTNTINLVAEEELAADSRTVFQEDEAAVARDLAELRTWISDTPHMRSTRTDELFLRLFLRGCNYNLKDTKEKLDMYFTVRWVTKEENNIDHNICMNSQVLDTQLVR